MAMFTTDAPQIIEHANKSLTFTPYDCKWVPFAPRFVVMGSNPRGTGALQIFEMRPGETSVIAEIERPSAIKCGTFAASLPENRHLATGDYAGNLAILDLERALSSSSSLSASAEGGGSATSSALPTATAALSGSGLTTSRPLATASTVFEAKAHTGIVNAIDGCGGLGIGGGAPEIVTGGRDGCVRVWDPRVADAVVSLEPAAAPAGASGGAAMGPLGTTTRDCWTVAFGNSYNDAERCLAAGYDNGDVKLFDLRTQTMRWETNVGNGVVNIEFDRKDIEMNKMVVTTLESRFRVYDLRTQHPTEGFAYLTEKAHKATIWMARHLPQNRELFLTAGGNGGLNIYKYKYPEKRSVKDEEGRLKGVIGSVELLNARVMSSQPFVGFDWSADKAGLACAVSLDQTARVYIVTKLNKH